MKNTKKIISTIVLTIAGAMAFAITDAQKTAASNLIMNEVRKGETYISDVEKVKDSPEIQTIAKWAEESPVDYQHWATHLMHNGIVGVQRAVRLHLNKDYPVNSPEDWAINDFRATFDDAMESERAYKNLRDSNFTPEGCGKMSDKKILSLVAKYRDIDYLKNLGDDILAENFNLVLKTVRRARLGAKEAYTVYSDLASRFADYKESKKNVKDNWENLQADKNEAFMQYFAQSKLESLGK